MSDNTERQSQLLREVQMLDQSASSSTPSAPTEASSSTASAHTERELQLLHDVSVMPTVQAVVAPPSPTASVDSDLPDSEYELTADEKADAQRFMRAQETQRKKLMKEYTESDSVSEFKWSRQIQDEDENLRLRDLPSIDNLTKRAIDTCILHQLSTSARYKESTNIELEVIDAEAVYKLVMSEGKGDESSGLLQLFVMRLLGARTDTDGDRVDRFKLHDSILTKVAYLLDDDNGSSTTDLQFSDEVKACITEHNFGVNQHFIKKKYARVDRWENSRNGKGELSQTQLLSIMDARTPKKKGISYEMNLRKKAQDKPETDLVRFRVRLIVDDGRGGKVQKDIWASDFYTVLPFYTGKQKDGTYLLQKPYEDATQNSGSDETLHRKKADYADVADFCLQLADVSNSDMERIVVYLNRMKLTRQTVLIQKPQKSIPGFERGAKGQYQKTMRKGKHVTLPVTYDFENPNSRQNFILIVSPIEKFMRVGDTIFVAEWQEDASVESSSSGSDGSASWSEGKDESSDESSISQQSDVYVTSDEGDAEEDKERFRYADRRGHTYVKRKPGDAIDQREGMRSQGRLAAQRKKPKPAPSARPQAAPAAPQQPREGPGGGGFTKRKRVLSDDEC